MISTDEKVRSEVGGRKSDDRKKASYAAFFLRVYIY